jgi:hypothetical protein
MAISLTTASGDPVSSFGSGSSQWATGARANEAAFGQRDVFGTRFASPGQTPITDTESEIGNGQMYPGPEGPEGIGTHNGMRGLAGGSSRGGKPHLLASEKLGTAKAGDALSRKVQFETGQQEARPQLPESPNEPPAEPTEPTGGSSGGPPDPAVSDEDAVAMMQHKNPAVAFVGGAIAGARDLL